MARLLKFVVQWTAADGKPDLCTFSSRAAAVEAQRRISGASLHLHMLGEDRPLRLSEPQRAFLRSFAREGQSVCPAGFHNAAAQASAWWRTCHALEDAGLVRRNGVGSQVALLTTRGLAVALSLLDGEES